MNFLEAEPAGPGQARCRLGPYTLTVAVDGAPGVDWTAGLLVVRPEAVGLARAAGAPRDRPCGRVRKAVFLGSVAEYEVEVGDTVVLVSVADPVAGRFHAEGDQVALAFPDRPIVLVGRD